MFLFLEKNRLIRGVTQEFMSGNTKEVCLEMVSRPQRKGSQIASNGADEISRKDTMEVFARE